MRIAFLTTEFVTEENRLAGAANFLARMVLALKKLGQEPEVFTWSNQNGCIEWKGVPIHRISWKRGLPHRVLNKLTLEKWEHPLLICQMFLRLRKRLRDVQKYNPFDVVHAAGSGCTAFAPISLGLPTVTRLSGYQPDIYRLSDQPLSLQRSFSCYLEVLAARNSTKKYAPSRLVAERYAQNHNLILDVQEPCFTLDVPQSEFASIPSGLKGIPYLLYFGPLSYLKGIDVLAEALRSVLHEMPETRAVFVGSDRGIGTMPARDFILNKVGIKSSERCCFLGELPHEELYPIVQNAKAVAIPSRLDNIPNTCIEAMAFGKVVVGTLGASLEQLIVNGESGFLVPQENPTALARAIIKALSLSEEASLSVGKAAKARIDGLCPEEAGAKLIDIMQNAIMTSERNQRKPRLKW